MTLKLRDPKCLNKDQLTVGGWYKGAGRNAHIGLWTGDIFQTFGLKFGQYVVKMESHWDDDGPFQPFEQI